MTAPADLAAEGRVHTTEKPAKKEHTFFDDIVSVSYTHLTLPTSDLV